MPGDRRRKKSTILTDVEYTTSYILQVTAFHRRMAVDYCSKDYKVSAALHLSPKSYSRFATIDPRRRFGVKWKRLSC